MAFLKAFLIRLLACLLAVHLVFGAVNPLGSFWGHWFPTTTPAARMRKRALFDAWQQSGAVEGLILGSSRSMMLVPKAFAAASGRRFFNFAVSDGRLEDVDAILAYAAERNAPVREIVIGIDPLMLTPGALPQELRDDWVFAPRVEGRRNTVLWRIGHGARLVKESLRPSFVREVVTSVSAKLTHREPLHTFFVDGALEYQARDRAIAAGTYNRKSMIRKCIGEIMDSLKARHTFDPNKLALLGRILADARARNISVTLWMTPYHPDLLNAAAEREPRLAAWLAQAPDTIGRIAAPYGVTFVNLQTAGAFGGDPEDWYDCVHFRPANAARIMVRLRPAVSEGLR